MVPVIFLQSSQICGRARLYTSYELSWLVLLCVQVEAVTIEIINFDDLTESRLRWITSHFKF